MTFRFSSRSLRNMEGVHPDLIAVAHRALELTEIDFLVTEGLRTREKQIELVRAGASRTTRSRHLTGHAIDIAAWVAGGVRWDWPLYEELSRAFKQAASELGVPLVWGGDWKTFRDGPHYELSRTEYPE